MNEESQQTEQQQQQQQQQEQEEEENRNLKIFKKYGVAFHGSSISSAIGSAIFSTLLPISLKEMNKNSSMIGLIVSAIGLGRLLADVPSTFLAKKYGAYAVIVCSCLISGVVFALPSIEYRVWIFVLTAIVGGAVLACYATPRLQLMQLIEKSERNILSAQLGATARSSYLVGPLIAGVIFTEFSHQISYVSSVIFFVLSFFCVGVFGRNQLSEMSDELFSKQKEEEEEKQKQKRRKARSRKRRSSFSSNDDDDGCYGSTTNNNNNNNNVNDEANVDDADEEEAEEENQSERPTSTSQVYVSPISLPTSPATIFTGNAVESSLLLLGNEKQKDEDAENNSCSCCTFSKTCKTIFEIGVIAISTTSLRQCRRLAITFRCLDLGYNAKQLGYVMALSFSIDIFLFWVSSTVSNRYGFRFAAVPLCLLFGAAFLILSFDSSKNDSSNVTLIVASVVFGLADSFGTGLMLQIAGELVPRNSIGIIRLIVDAGVLCGPVALGVLTDNMSLSTANRVLACWSLFTAVWSAVFLP